MREAPGRLHRRLVEKAVAPVGDVLFAYKLDCAPGLRRVEIDDRRHLTRPKPQVRREACPLVITVAERRVERGQIKNQIVVESHFFTLSSLGGE